MAQKQSHHQRPIEAYERRDKQRVNNPPAGLGTPETDPDAGQKKKTYAYDPRLDPQLNWAGKVQMISINPPYGIKYGSNFQPFVDKRDVKDGRDEDLTCSWRGSCSPRSAASLCRVPTRTSGVCAVWRDRTHRTSKVRRRGCQHE